MHKALMCFPFRSQTLLRCCRRFLLSCCHSISCLFHLSHNMQTLLYSAKCSLLKIYFSSRSFVVFGWDFNHIHILLLRFPFLHFALFGFCHCTRSFRSLSLLLCICHFHVASFLYSAHSTTSHEVIKLQIILMEKVSFLDVAHSPLARMLCVRCGVLHHVVTNSLGAAQRFIVTNSKLLLLGCCCVFNPENRHFVELPVCIINSNSAPRYFCVVCNISHRKSFFMSHFCELLTWNIRDLREFFLHRENVCNFLLFAFMLKTFSRTFDDKKKIAKKGEKSTQLLPFASLAHVVCCTELTLQPR